MELGGILLGMAFEAAFLGFAVSLVADLFETQLVKETKKISERDKSNHFFVTILGPPNLG